MVTLKFKAKVKSANEYSDLTYGYSVLPFFILFILC